MIPTVNYAPVSQALMGIDNYLSWSRFSIRTTITSDAVKVELIEYIHEPDFYQVHSINVYRNGEQGDETVEVVSLDF
jgi:hypothetical protein